MSDFEVCSLSPVCASSGETAHRSFEPATGHWTASAQERRTQIPTTWLSIPRTNTCNRWESSICLSLGSRRPRMPGCTHVRSSSAKSDTSLCWRWNAGGTVRKRGGRWIDRITPDLLSHSSPITSQSWTKTDVFTLFNLSNVWSFTYLQLHFKKKQNTYLTVCHSRWFWKGYVQSQTGLALLQKLSTCSCLGRDEGAVAKTNRQESRCTCEIVG